MNEALKLALDALECWCMGRIFLHMLGYQNARIDRLTPRLKEMEK